MRKIKFRGKRVDNGKWVYGDLFQSFCEDKAFINPTNCLNMDEYDFREVDKETVGQFIGVLDKNGKEMYEDDVMQIINGKCKVDMHYSTLYHIEHHKIEIIGNIHDNPELLK